MRVLLICFYVRGAGTAGNRMRRDPIFYIYLFYILLLSFSLYVIFISMTMDDSMKRTTVVQYQDKYCFSLFNTTTLSFLYSGV